MIYFDNSKPLIEPQNFYKKIETSSEICIVTFSYKVIDYIKTIYELKILTYYSTANGKVAIYTFTYNNKEFLIYMSPIGSNIAGTILDEVSYITNVKKFIFFGSCGILDKKCQNKIIVPNFAYRDEGFSYHYLEAGDYINIKNYQKIEKILAENGINYIVGKTWTTDAIYRETINKINKRKEEGCLTVEMECAGLEAITRYRNIDLYIFFFAGDILANDIWERGHLGGKNEEKRQANAFNIALILAQNI